MPPAHVYSSAVRKAGVAANDAAVWPSVVLASLRALASSRFWQILLKPAAAATCCTQQREGGYVLRVAVRAATTEGTVTAEH